MRSFKSGLSHFFTRFTRPIGKGLLAAGLLALLPGSAHAAGTWGSCTPIEVMSFSSRIHVRCASTFGANIRYVAMPTSNTAEAARALSIAQSALVAGRTVTFWYESTATGAPIGCLTTDCRVMTAIGAQ